MAYLKKMIICENCLVELNFDRGHIYWYKNPSTKEGSFYINCFRCANPIELFDLEDYGIKRKEVSNYDEKDELDEG